jgi:hypothetical protein
MWVFTRYGFYSIACASQTDGSLDFGTVMIRARRAAHLSNLQKRFPALADQDIVALPNRDYRYRLIISKEVWAAVVTELAREQEWSNFKNEVASYQGRADPEYVHALHEVWRCMGCRGESTNSIRVLGAQGEPALGGQEQKWSEYRGPRNVSTV